MADVNPPVDYVLIGKIVNNDNQPISEAVITSALGESTTSQENGDFTLIGKYIPGQIFIVNIFATDYGQKTINPFNLKKQLKNNGGLGIIKLKPSKLDLEEAISQELPLSVDQIRSLQLSKMDFEMAKQQAMNNLVKQIKTVLLPQVLTLISAFGISKAKDALGKKFGDMNATCPANLDELNALIKKKNRLTKTLNNILKFLTTVRVGVIGLNATITVAEIVVKTLGSSYNLAPIAGLGAPDVSKPVGKARDRIEEELKKYKLISSATIIVLTILIQILQIILDYLKLLDSLVQGCAIEGQLPQEQLSQNLLEATQEQSQQLSPVVTNINGFEMSVIPVDSAVIGGLKRRQAIARNPSGIIMLRGEPSFSSNDQILIDELVYYIQSNNLTVDGVGPPVFNEDNNNTTTPTTSTPVSTGTGGSIGGGGGGGGGY